MASPGAQRKSMSLSRVGSPREEDRHLFEPPAELVCPLTLAPFVDPVLTAAGHVYERGAIQAHLERSNADPLTRTPLLNKSLTPVYVLRSRALEYRERAAKACVERVCGGASSSGAGDPARYLRRAVELVADTGSHVQGLSKSTVDYVLSHPSAAYDECAGARVAIALQMFAQGLFQAGYRDRAAAIYARLLLHAADRRQQAEMLQRCLSCWADDRSDASGGGGAHQADGIVFEKLQQLFSGQAGADGRPSLPPEQLVDLAQHASLGNPFVLRLCEQLLFRPPPLGGGDDGGGSPRQQQQQQQRLLLKYVHVLTDSLQQRQAESERRVAELERWQRGRARGRTHGSRASLAASDDSSGTGWLPRWVLVLAALLTVALPDGPPARVLRAAPLLALLPAGGS